MPTTAPAPRQGAALPLLSLQAPDKVSGLFHAGTILARLLEKGRVLDAKLLRGAMEEAFDIEIPDEDAEKIQTSGDALSYVRDRVEG